MHIYSGLEKTVVYDFLGSQNHTEDTKSKIDMQVLRENCKRRAE
jgi:hypothetical protein